MQIWGSLFCLCDANVYALSGIVIDILGEFSLRQSCNNSTKEIFENGEEGFSTWKHFHEKNEKRKRTSSVNFQITHQRVIEKTLRFPSPEWASFTLNFLSLSCKARKILISDCLKSSQHTVRIRWNSLNVEMKFRVHCRHCEIFHVSFIPSI